MKSRPAPLDVALLAALLAVVLSVTYAYVGVERYFYYWDFAVHQDLAQATASAFRQSWAAGWHVVGESLTNDYNALFALPLVPILVSVPFSRLAYELSLATVYLCPFALSIGALASRVFAGPARTVFWTAAFLTLFVPMSWVPTLRGFPDASAATLVVLATCVYRIDDDRRSLPNAAVIGALLALSVLFRRHFLYAALVFVASAVLYEVGRLVSRGPGRGDAAKAGVDLVLRLLVGAGAAILVVVALGRGFVERLRSYDFMSLYRAYEEPPLVVLDWYASAYGPAALTLAGLGWVLAWRARLVDRRRTAFLALFAALSILQWLLAVRQVGEQYTLHFTPVIVLGLAALLWRIWHMEAPLARALARTAFTAVLVANVVFGLSTVAVQSSARDFFGGAWVPLVRWDYPVLVEFIDYLRQTSNPEQGIYVVASSHTINPDLLRHAERTLHANPSLGFLAVPTVDSRDEYPLGPLLAADHVVLVRPLQIHLRPAAQQVLQMVYDVFTNDDEIARDFSLRPDRYPLEGGATLSVYSRRRPTALGTALRTLTAIQRRIPSRPGQQADWIPVNQRFHTWVGGPPSGPTEWVAHPSPRGQTPSTVLAWLNPMPLRAEISGTVSFVDRRCAGVTLAFATAEDDGALTPLAALQRRPGEDGRFQVTVAPERGRLVISLLDYADGVSIDFCLLKVDPLVVRPMPR